MHRRVVAAVVATVALVTAVGFVGWWIATHDVESPRSSSPNVERTGARLPEPAATAPAPATATADREATRVEQPGAPAPDPSATWIVEGRALRGWPDPFPSAHVKLQLFDGFEAKGTAKLEVRLQADAEGRFRWALPPPSSTVTLLGSGDEPQCWTSHESALAVVGRPPPKLEIRMCPFDCEVSGFVRDVQGRPIAGATLVSTGAKTTSDAAGHYSIRASSTLKESYVTATAAHYAQADLTVQLSGPGSTATANFELVTSFRVKGRVVDAAGAPIEGATVRSFYTGEDGTTSGSDGRFVLDYLDPRRSRHSVHARKEGYVQAQVSVDVAGEELEIADLVLKRGVRIEGSVVDDTNAPVAGARLYIGMSPFAYDRLDATSHDDGTFLFPNVPTGAQTMVTSCTGLAPDRRVLTLSEEQPVVAGLVIRLASGHFVGGVIHDEAGNPVSGVGVSTRHGGDYIEPNATSDESGRFHVDGLPANDVSLELYSRTIVRKTVPVAQLDDDDLEIVVQASGKLAGRVVDGVSGKPLEEFVIRFVRPDDYDRRQPPLSGYGANWSREGHRFTGTHGVWDTGNETLAPGGATGIEVRADGYAPTRIGRVVVSRAPDPDACVARMFVGASVRGRVVDADGKPIAAARVAVKSASDPTRSFSDEPYEAGTTQSRDDGTFEIGTVAPGASVLLVQAPRRPFVVDGPFDVPTSGAVDRRVELPRGLTLVGELLDAAGTPLPNESVTIFESTSKRGEPQYSATTTTNAAGHFEFAGLSEGLFQLSHSVRDGDASAFVFTLFARVAAGADNRVVLQPRGSGSIVGTIQMKDGSEVPPRLAVTASSNVDSGAARENAPPQLGAIARDGHFRIDGVTPGTYQVSIFHWTASRRLNGAASVLVGQGEATVQVELVEMPAQR
jgi:protocatechuate 3,4-dioxygenase beta subunit